MSKNGFKFVFVLTILSVFLFTGSAILFAENVHAIRTGRVNTASLNIRSGPDITYTKIGSVKKGMKLEIIEQKNGWYKVKVWKMHGWVKNDFLSTKSKVPEAPDTSSGNIGSGSDKPDSGDSSKDPESDTGTGKYLVIKGSTVNVRSGAGTDYPVVTKVKAPEKYEVVQRQGDWYKINLYDGNRGWVAGWLTQVVDPTLPSRGDTGTNIPELPDNSEIPDNSNTPDNPDTPDDSDNPDNPDTPDDSDNPDSDNSDNQDSTDNDTGTAPDQDQNNNGHNTVVKLSNIYYDTSEPDSETVVITGSGPIQYSITSLKDPLRLVIDIKNCEINGLKDIEADGRLLQNIRLSQYSVFPMAVRIVFDLNNAVDFVPFISEDGTSLRITLAKPSIRGKVIVLDPGHGGMDNGATGVTGLKEKDVNLDTALKLRDKLIALGATVIMTREDDTFISLTERSRIANDAQADVFVSIHANANVNPAIKGTSTYFYTLIQAEQRERLARLVQNNLIPLLGTRDIGILQANFSVLRGTQMPSILVESAFLSNADDEQLLKEDGFRDKVAQGIANGLTQYFTGN